jgi:dienelactone hydrolase
MNAEFAAHGQDARNAIQLQLLENREIRDSLAGIAFLRALPEVDARRIAVVGDSFGGSLTVLEAERDSAVRAAVVFSCAGYSWDKSPQLRARLLAAVDRAAPPIFFIHAANDYSLAPGKALDAELKRLRKRSRLKIYPPVGRSADDGHGFLYLRVSTWEPDVFAFLDEHMRRRAPRPPASRVNGRPISRASRASGAE